MIAAITYNFHDHEPRIIYVDSDLLDVNDFVDLEVLKGIQNNENVFIDAANWEDYPDKFPDDPDISGKAILKGKPKKIDVALVVSIDFDC